jgi:glycerol-3-phosphate dehydrogenase (NAD(P)+)
LVNNGATVNTWARTESKAEEMASEQSKLPESASGEKQVNFTGNIATAMRAAEVVVLAVPAQSLRQNVKQLAKYVSNNMIFVSLAKGLEADTGKRMSQIIIEEISSITQDNVCVLSGPNLSQEINQGLPASSVLAAYDSKVAEKTKQLFDVPNFAVYTSDDITGVELCGALKNVIALGAGMVDGLGLGNNAKATLITLGWSDVTLLGVALGAKSMTFYGLAGLGDLITTCAGSLSRNHYVGREVATGRSLAEVKASMSNIAEGIDTTIAAHRLSCTQGVDTPIINLIHGVLFESLPPIEITNRFRNGLK